MLRRYDVTFYENVGLTKTVKSNGRYFFRLHLPGWPSKAFDQFMESELDHLFSEEEKPHRLQFIVLGVTKQCPLRCRHCYEWERLNQDEDLSVDELAAIVKLFQQRGISQIMISGGEPMVCFEKVLRLLQSADSSSDFWLFTSGYHLTFENALKLKKAGLTGVNVSLDHWDAAFHNAFRGHPSAFEWAVKASRNVRKADLVLCLSLCATKEFVSKENLWKYAAMAKELGAGFIQILEPRSTGHFKGKDVQLSQLQLETIEEFHVEINVNPAYRNLPSVMYAGYHQRRSGCFGGGKRFLYVDTDGYLHACPFCQNAVGHCLKEPLEESVSKMQKTGCLQFNPISHPFFWD